MRAPAAWSTGPLLCACPAPQRVLKLARSRRGAPPLGAAARMPGRPAAGPVSTLPALLMLGDTGWLLHVHPACLWGHGQAVGGCGWVIQGLGLRCSRFSSGSPWGAPLWGGFKWWRRGWWGMRVAAQGVAVWRSPARPHLGGAECVAGGELHHTESCGGGGAPPNSLCYLRRNPPPSQPAAREGRARDSVLLGCALWLCHSMKAVEPCRAS